MKKTISIILVLAFTLVCTACGNEPIDYYADGVKKFYKETLCRIDFVSTQSVAGTDVISNGSYSGTVKLANDDGETAVLSLSGTSSIDPGLGSNIDVPIEGYYYEGALYQKMSGSAYYLPATWDEAHELFGLIVGPVSGAEEADFKAIATTQEGGNTAVNFIITPDAAAHVNGLVNQLERYAGLNGGGNYTITDIRGTLNLDSSRLPVSESLTVAGEVAYEQETVSITNEISLSFSYPEGMTVDTPVAADYKLAE